MEVATRNPIETPTSPRAVNAVPPDAAIDAERKEAKPVAKEASPAAFP